MEPTTAAAANGNSPAVVAPGEQRRQVIYQPPRFSWLSFVATVVVLTALPVVSTARFLPWGSPEDIGNSTIMLAITLGFALAQAVLVYPLIHLFKWLYYRFRQKKIVEDELDKLQQGIEEDFFNNLVKINFKYIDKYYLQTQVQADKSFILSCIAAVVSLIVIVVGISMMFFDKTNVTPALVTTAAGVLGEMISSVFFYLYTQTVIKMSEYHQKLVLTQNISLALKISEELSEPDKSEARGKLIDYLARDINLYLSHSAPPASPAVKKNGAKAAAASR